jgi:DHA1 family bicyclomycin/chloramphenicol resistance-like MFS transporter
VPLSISSPTAARDREYRLGRTELLALISAIMALTAVAIDLMLPAFDDIRDTFNLADGSADTGQIVTVYFLGLAVAQVFYGPLADRFGRKPTLYLGIGIYIVGAMGSALAPTFGLLLLGRFVWGAGAAGTRVVAMAIVRDRFEGDAMAKAMSQVMVVFMLVPIVAPAVGSAIVSVVPWPGLFWLCVAGALMVLQIDGDTRPCQSSPTQSKSHIQWLCRGVPHPGHSGLHHLSDVSPGSFHCIPRN